VNGASSNPLLIFSAAALAENPETDYSLYETVLTGILLGLWPDSSRGRTGNTQSAAVE
jgi:hypothetical protein